MIQINDQLLDEVGLGSLPETEKKPLLGHIYETLELRVGMRLADQMTNQQLDEFEKYFEARDDKGAFAWLETNFPNYKEIVQQEFDKLKMEVSQSAPQILSTAQTQSLNGGTNPSPTPNQSQPTPAQMPQPQAPMTTQPPNMPQQADNQPPVPRNPTGSFDPNPAS